MLEKLFSSRAPTSAVAAALQLAAEEKSIARARKAALRADEKLEKDELKAADKKFRRHGPVRTDDEERMRKTL